MHLGNDIRYAFRQLRRSPGFAVTAIVTLAIGIGATTAIFSLMYVSMLKPLAVKQPQQLYKVGLHSTCCDASHLLNDWSRVSYDLYTHLRDNTRGFDGSLAAFQSGLASLLVHRQGDSQASMAIFGKMVSGNYFNVLGAPIAMGRGLTPADDTPAAPPAAVISARMWERRFGRNPAIVGQTLMMNGTATTIVGVAAPAFVGETLQPDMPELWIPLQQESKYVREGALLNRPDHYWLDAIGRVAPGASLSQIDAQLNTELRQWLHSRAATMEPNERAAIDRQHTELASAATGINYFALTYDSGLKMMMWAAGFVMLIVCANVANLLLVRALAQTQQSAVRMALGASREQLLQQALVTSLVLSLIGCTAAIPVAYFVCRWFVTIAFGNLDAVPFSVAPSPAILAFAFTTAVVTSIVFGVGPAWISTRSNLASVLRAASRTTRSSGTASQRSLVVLQSALSVVLLCSAGLLTRSLSNLKHQDLNLDTRDRYVITIDPALAGYTAAQTNQLDRRIEERMMQIPGAQHVGLAIYAPMSGERWTDDVFQPGVADPQPLTGWLQPMWNRVSTDYFAAVGSRLREGRTFTNGDTDTTQKVAIVSQTFVHRFLKGDPLGQHFGVEGARRSQFEIVGVLRDTKYIFPDLPAPPMFFLPLSQTSDVANPSRSGYEAQSHFAGNVVLEVRGMNGADAEAAMRRAMRDVDANLPVTAFYTFPQLVNYGFTENELLSTLCGFFAAIALLLAAIGIYGVTAYSVQRRTGDIGIRMALGASRRRILGEVILQSLTYCGIGLAVGVVLSFLSGRLLSRELFGVGSFDLSIVSIAVLLLTLSAAAAALLPARRAASIEPMQALRQE